MCTGNAIKKTAGNAQSCDEQCDGVTTEPNTDHTDCGMSLFYCLGSFARTVNATVFVSIVCVMCKQHHRTALHIFLIFTKNGDYDGTSDRALIFIHCGFLEKPNQGQIKDYRLRGVFRRGVVER